MGQAGTDQLSESRLQFLPRSIDAPEAKPTVKVHSIEKDRDGHDQIDPVGWRHEVDEPREIPIGEFRLAGQKELLRLGCKRHERGWRQGAWWIAAHKTWQFGSQQHEKRDPIRPFGAMVGDDERREARDLLLSRWYRTHQVETTCRNVAQGQPGI